jgi:hypothetical protein
MLNYANYLDHANFIHGLHFLMPLLSWSLIFIYFKTHKTLLLCRTN